MNKTLRYIRINGGQPREVVNTYSCGPGQRPHTYLYRNSYGEVCRVEEHCGVWTLYQGWLAPSYTVTVEVEPASTLTSDWRAA